MFGQNASSLGSTSGNRHSIEIKAGRMTLVDSEQGGVKKKMVHPDQRYVGDDCAKICIPQQIYLLFPFRKGLLYIYSADDEYGKINGNMPGSLSYGFVFVSA